MIGLWGFCGTSCSRFYWAAVVHKLKVPYSDIADWDLHVHSPPLLRAFIVGWSCIFTFISTQWRSFEHISNDEFAALEFCCVWHLPYIYIYALCLNVSRRSPFSAHSLDKSMNKAMTLAVNPNFINEGGRERICVQGFPVCKETGQSLKCSFGQFSVHRSLMRKANDQIRLEMC